ncbi:hypothetical protein K488DRAFT_73388 [Vararia minispora EC-137]|uniref:Uncharacterized protein n=1 Tax=Vararia minispora EC-137 TaxID=1314806 RepID=A0ACB8QAQ1_9AGAM|nr:hypothetical protein K488DRAFT_73388 [Vararia minispora EC-137]
MSMRFAYLDLALPATPSPSPFPPDYGDTLGDHDPLIAPSSSRLEDPTPLSLDLAVEDPPDMDATLVSFPSLFPRDYTVLPLLPASPPSPSTSSDTSDSDFSPPPTPTLNLEPLLPLDCPPRNHKPLTCSVATAPLSDELFDADAPRIGIAPDCSHACAEVRALDLDIFDEDEEPQDYFAAYSPALAFAQQCMAEAYLYTPIASSVTPLCLYDPAWHADAQPLLPCVYVLGCADSAPEPEPQDQDWDYLVVPEKTSAGRISAVTERYCEPPLDEQEEEADAFGRRQRIGLDGEWTFVPERVAGRRWLWKNFWTVIYSDLTTSTSGYHVHP